MDKISRFDPQPTPNPHSACDHNRSSARGQATCSSGACSGSRTAHAIRGGSSGFHQDLARPKTGVSVFEGALFGFGLKESQKEIHLKWWFSKKGHPNRLVPSLCSSQSWVRVVSATEFQRLAQPPSKESRAGEWRTWTSACQRWSPGTFGCIEPQGGTDR